MSLWRSLESFFGLLFLSLFIFQMCVWTFFLIKKKNLFCSHSQYNLLWYNLAHFCFFSPLPVFLVFYTGPFLINPLLSGVTPSLWKAWQPIPVVFPGESHGQRSLVGYSSWGHKESDTTERLTHTHTHTHTQSAGALGIQAGSPEEEFDTEVRLCHIVKPLMLMLTEKKNIMWELWVKFYLEQNKDYSLA